ncbi:MAG: hypothetical protein WKF57_06060 [Nakamurella sp.]
MSRKKNSASSTPWLEAPEVPVAGISDPAKVEKRSKWMRRAVFSSVLLVPVMAITMILILGGKAANETPAAAAMSSSQGQAAATATLQQWLAQTPAPIPGGRILSWAGASMTTAPAPADGSSVGYPTEIDYFIVADQTGVMYRSSLLVSLDPSGAAQVISLPSLELMPTARGDGVGAFAEWGGLRSVGSNPSLDAAVQNWASAYAGGDPDTLRLAVGDPDAEHAYLPLTGVSAVTSQVTGAVSTAPAPSSDNSTLIARVQMQLQSPTSKPDTAAWPQISFDILIQRADSAAPQIVAWGAPGTGLALTAYQNAVPVDSTEGDGGVVTTFNPPSTIPAPISSSSPAATPSPTSKPASSGSRPSSTPSKTQASTKKTGG